MRHPAIGAGLLVQLLFLAFAAWPGCAAASPASGPHETLDNRYTTTEPNAAAGFDFTGSYHAAGDPAETLLCERSRAGDLRRGGMSRRQSPGWWHVHDQLPGIPSVQPAGCPVDDVLQLESSISVAPYTRSSDGVVQSYLTTPPTCPAAGHWETPVRLWFADGSVDTVTTEQPCVPNP